ncbi:hypothetical protein FKP32DRAFT_1606172 [Trametes sanguinea]|nr:hypothetical protein FKP32DRAFT_1606172 [Trametes sanguinea]
MRTRRRVIRSTPSSSSSPSDRELPGPDSGPRQLRSQARARPSTSAIQTDATRRSVRSERARNHTSGQEQKKAQQPEDELGNSPKVRHHYGTRKSTQRAHPARDLGLHKRTREEIQDAAAEKRARKLRKAQDQEEEAQRFDEGLRRVSELEREYLARQAEEEALLRAPPSLSMKSMGTRGDKASQRAGHDIREDRPQPIVNSRCTPADEDENHRPGEVALTPEVAQSSSNQNGVPRNTLASFVGVYSETSSSGSDEDEGLLSVLTRKRRRGQKTLVIEAIQSESEGDAFHAEEDPTFCEDEGRFEDDYTVPDFDHDSPEHMDWNEDGANTINEVDPVEGPLDDGFGSGTREDDECINDDDDADAVGEYYDAEEEGEEFIEEEQAPSRKKRKRDDIRKRIKSFQVDRPQQAGSGRSAKRQQVGDKTIGDRRNTRSSSSKEKHSVDAFRPAWRRAHVHGAKPSQHRYAGDQPGEGTRSTSTGWHSALQAGSRTPGPSTPARGTSPLAFTDADVHTSRQYAINMSASRRTPDIRVRKLTDSDRDVDGVTNRAVATPQKAPRQRRRAPVDVPEEHSRSSANVPDVLKPVMYTKVIPTILDYFGARQDPWGICEQGGRNATDLLELCQEIIDEIRQRIYDWRSNFANAAVIAIGDAITARFGSRPSRSAVHAWVVAATSDGGEAFWAQPHANPAMAHGKMQSPFILRSFATHLTATEGSIRDYGYPGGALALATTAVQHCFAMFSKGFFEPGKVFNASNVGALTDSWYHKVHRAFVEKPEKFDALIRSASRHTTAVQPRRNQAGILEAPDVFDRSSPPIEDHGDDMDTLTASAQAALFYITSSGPDANLPTNYGTNVGTKVVSNSVNTVASKVNTKKLANLATNTHAGLNTNVTPNAGTKHVAYSSTDGGTKRHSPAEILHADNSTTVPAVEGSSKGDQRMSPDVEAPISEKHHEGRTRPMAVDSGPQATADPSSKLQANATGITRSGEAKGQHGRSNSPMGVRMPDQPADGDGNTQTRAKTDDGADNPVNIRVDLRSDVRHGPAVRGNAAIHPDAGRGRKGMRRGDSQERHQPELTTTNQHQEESQHALHRNSAAAETAMQVDQAGPGQGPGRMDGNSIHHAENVQHGVGHPMYYPGYQQGGWIGPAGSYAYGPAYPPNAHQPPPGNYPPSIHQGQFGGYVMHNPYAGQPSGGPANYQHPPGATNYQPPPGPTNYQLPPGPTNYQPPPGPTNYQPPPGPTNYQPPPGPINYQPPPGFLPPGPPMQSAHPPPSPSLYTAPLPTAGYPAPPGEALGFHANAPVHAMHGAPPSNDHQHRKPGGHSAGVDGGSSREK